MKKKSTKLISGLLLGRVYLLAAVLSLFSVAVSAQNLALTATFTHSTGGSGAYGPQNYNDQVNVAGTFGWSNGTGATCWIIADWGSTTVNIDTIRIFPDGTTSRTLTAGDVQYWNGSTWVTHYTFSVAPALMFDIALPTTMSTTRMRITNVTVSGTQTDNPSIREIEVYENSSKGTNNLGITNITPSYPCAGANNISVEVRNFGKNQVDDFVVNWTINGVPQTAYNYNATPLDTNKGTGINKITLNLGQHTYINNKLDTIKVWTSDPNGGVDTVTDNDTIELIRKPSKSGTYTVGGLGADYASLIEAFEDLSVYGVCGPVILDCDGSETFSGHIEITAIPGASSTNNIYVKGNGAKVTHNTPSTTDRTTIRFNGGAWVTLDNLDIETTGTSYGWAVHIFNSSNNTVKDCKITVPTQTSSNYIPVVISGSETSYTTATSGNNNTVEGCDLSGGYLGLGLYASGNTSKDNLITNNEIHNFYVYGIYYVGSTDSEISNNDIYRSDRTGTITTFYGIYINGNAANTVVNANKIHDSYPTGNTSNYTSMGIYLVTNTTLNANSGVVLSNNLIYNTEGYGATLNYGIYNANSYYTKIYNNTILMTRTNTSGPRYGIATRLSGTERGEEIRNNNIVVGGGNSDNKYGLYIGSLNIGTPPVVNNNNVHRDGVGSGTTYWGAWSDQGGADLEDWNDINGNMFDGNLQADPAFRNAAAGDYEPKDARLNGAGVNFAGITADHNGVSRGSSKFDIGAFIMDCDFGITAFTLPNATECELYTPEIEVTIRNYSAKEYLNIPVGVSINNLDQVNNFAPVTLAPGVSANYTYENSYTFMDAGDYKVRVFPLDDELATNDTQSFDITIKPAPRGAVLTEGANNEAIYRGGILTNYDVIKAGDLAEYNVSIPTSGGTFTDANYGSAWDIPVSVETMSGIVLANTMYSVVAPTSSSDAVVKFTPSSAYVDSILKVIIPVRNLDNSCDSTIERYIFIAPVPFVNFNGTAVCDGDGVGFENLSTISSGTITYEWDFGVTPTVTSTNTNPIYKYPTFGIYDVKLTATSDWGYKHDTIIKVEVYESPNINFRPINACEGDAVEFQNNTTVSSGTLNYTWNFGDGSALDMSTSPNHTYAVPGEYEVTLTASVSGCERTIKKSAFQFPQPTADFDIDGGECNEQEVEFTDKSSISFGKTGNLWDFGDLNYSTEKNTKHSFMAAGSQTITLKVTSEFGCEDVAVKQVTLKESPIASFDNSQTCDIDPVEFTNTSFEPTGTNVDYTWTFGDPTSTSNTSNLTNPEHKYSLPGARKVRLLAEADNGCSNEVTKDIVIGVQPQADFDVEAGCTGEEIKFNNETVISRGDIEVVYNWSFGSNDVSPNHIYTTPGTKSVTLTATATEGGCTDEITKDVVIGSTPVCDFTSETDGHLNVSFSPTETNPNYTYSWEFGDGGFSSSINPSYTYNFKATYEVKLRITTPEGCMCENTVTSRKTSVGDINFAERVNIYPNPSTGVFTIAIDGDLSEDVSIQVYNSLGAVVAVVDVNQSVDGKYIVNLGDVAAGVYTVKFTSNSSVYTQKVTVTK